MGLDSAKNFYKEIKRNPSAYYIIHYSCQSLYDDNDTLSPRISAIVVMHFETKQVVSFATHTSAEALQIPRDKCPDRADDIEKELLIRFEKFMSERRDRIWLHWNMKNIVFGFEHIEHRYRLLTGRDMPVIPVERRMNINDIFENRYGPDFIAKPRMQALMEKNGGLRRNFLTGPQEVDAFKNMEFSKMHASTACKVEFFRDALSDSISGKLKTTGSGIGYRVDKLLETRLSKYIGIGTGAVGFISAIFGFLR